ncbi:MAG: amidase [Deltaproteobacteria bacterium]|nr:MAG: amidase [Deltaproteobacteria bacterium]TMQ22530.1 MAG: amidase [Deltaproteobacteria bacterium]
MADAATAPALGRRELFVGGATLVAGAALAACGHREEPRPAPAPSPRPNAAAAAQLETKAKAQAAASESQPGVELVELTFADLQARMAAGSDTAKSLVAKYRQRIEALDRKGPMLRSVLELNPDADTIADQLDAERKAGKLRGPLHGIPILIKDNIDTGDKMTTTAGSLALEGSHAAKDAFVVARLRDAGAIILGKTNLSEWANFRGKASSSGWSGRGGQCRNPYALDRSPSGSSSGSGAAAAASLCAAAIGSETDGSIVSPSSCNGLVGIKPTVGLVSRAGVVPLSASQDTLGPMARTVTDAAQLLTVIAGADPADPVTTAPDKARPPAGHDYTKDLDPKALAGARLGVPRKGFFDIVRGVDDLMRTALADLKGAGAELIDPAELPAPPELGDAELEVLMFELHAYLDKYLAGRGPDAHVHSLAEAIAFNKQEAARELAIFGQEWFEQAQAKPGLTDKAYLKAREKCVQIARTQLLDKVMAEHKLDAFVAATNGTAWLIDPVNGDAGGGLNTSTLPAISGYPHVTLPAGQYRGLPVGLSFFGRPYSEGKLIGLAFAYEQITKHRRPPRFLPTAELG